MKKVLIFILAVSLFAACKNDKKAKDDRSTTKEKDDYSTSDDKRDDDNGSGWTKSDESRFMSDCEGTAKQNVGAARANEYCDCMLQRMKKMYSSYTEADRDLAGATQDEINKLAAMYFYHQLKSETYVLSLGLFQDHSDFIFESQIFIDRKPDYYEFANDTVNLTQQQLFDKFAEKGIKPKD